MQESAQTLLVILNDVLDLSRISTGKISIEQRDFNLRQTVQSVAEVFRAEVWQKGLTLSVQIAASVPSVLSVDSHRIRQC